MEPKDKTGRYSNVATVAASIVAAAAFALSIFTYKQTNEIQKKIATFTFWQSYLEPAAQSPKYANGRYDSLLEFDDASERGRFALKIITLLTDASANVPMFVLRHLLNFLTFAFATGFAPVGTKQDREQLISGLKECTASGEQGAVVRLNSIAGKARPASARSL